MTFQWPLMLWLLLFVPLLIALYVWLLKRRKNAALRYASLGLVKAAIGPGQKWRRHVPPVLMLGGLILMIIAAARPAATVTLPSQHETIILAMDVSGSMRATDVDPNRLVAAQEAAKAFTALVPPRTRLGVVSFAGTAAVVQSPTQSREDIVAAIDRFQLQRGTAIGSGLILSLATLFPDAGIQLQQQRDPRDYLTENNDPNAPIGGSNNTGPKPFEPIPPGSYASAAVILLTDGRATTGPDPMEAARMAADRGVRVFTVGIGTAEGQTIGFEGWSMRVRLDEETLKNIANMTRGEYFYAGTAADLKKIYESLNSRLVMEKKQTEVSAIFAAAAAVLTLLAGLLSMLWFNRVL